jgi:hypothetical protein
VAEHPLHSVSGCGGWHPIDYRSPDRSSCCLALLLSIAGYSDQADQEKRQRNDSERAAIADQPDFVANMIAGVNKSSVSRAEIALRRENFTRQWGNIPIRNDGRSLKRCLATNQS